MNIAQALKEKNKIIAKLSKLYSRLHQNNSVATETVRAYDPKVILDQILMEESNLINIKADIHKASAPVRLDIFTQSELKNRIKQIRGLNTQHGKIRDHYNRSENPIEMNAVFGQLWVDEAVETLEKQIETIQENLDKFNHITNI